MPTPVEVVEELQKKFRLKAQPTTNGAWVIYAAIDGEYDKIIAALKAAEVA